LFKVQECDDEGKDDDVRRTGPRRLRLRLQWDLGLGTSARRADGMTCHQGADRCRKGGELLSLPLRSGRAREPLDRKEVTEGIMALRHPGEVRLDPSGKSLDRAGPLTRSYRCPRSYLMSDSTGTPTK
jgi:hypothetical protein